MTVKNDPNFPIYLDYHATTPVDPRVAELMLHYMTTEFGNASSTDKDYLCYVSWQPTTKSAIFTQFEKLAK